MKKLVTMMAMAAMVVAPTVSSATDFTDQVNVGPSKNVVVNGGQVIVTKLDDSSSRFHMSPGGIQIFRPGASYIDNRTIGASTRFRTSNAGDRDTLAMVLNPDGTVFFPVGNVNIQGGELAVSGQISSSVVEIRGAGNDLAESFKVNNPIKQVKAGMVVSIDPSNPGEMKLSSTPYDRKVAGIINGAGGLHAGIHLGDTHEAGTAFRQVALTGRVYVKADASNGVIKPGDMLTTSKVPGHAMKVTEYTKAQGAIIGKAMSPINKETGLVLVLVTLQ